MPAVLPVVTQCQAVLIRRNSTIFPGSIRTEEGVRASPKHVLEPIATSFPGLHLIKYSGLWTAFSQQSMPDRCDLCPWPGWEIPYKGHWIPLGLSVMVPFVPYFWVIFITLLLLNLHWTTTLSAPLLLLFLCLPKVCLPLPASHSLTLAIEAISHSGEPVGICEREQASLDLSRKWSFFPNQNSLAPISKLKYSSSF